MLSCVLARATKADAMTKWENSAFRDNSAFNPISDGKWPMMLTHAVNILTTERSSQTAVFFSARL